MTEIELENFKSFGHHLRLPLLPGYTAITGPNGSGKSNLADAILFVLGPKSSKVIRAGRLTDLIYNGGKDGKPAKHCRVSLVFDNTDRVIPLDEDEVRLTRYVAISEGVKDGYNSYFYVNGRKANLQAFDDLLAHARISAEGYNIVQQGDVAKIVEMSVVERRRVLEAIAGISQFDEDIGKAESKKRGVEEDLERIEIILGEIRRQLNQLEKDRQSALRYRELQEKLEEARGQEAHKEVQVLMQQVASNQKQMSKYRQDRDALREGRAQHKAALEVADEKLREMEAEVAKSGGDEFRGLKDRLDFLRIERARAQDGVERAKEAVKRLRSEGRVVTRELTKISKELAGLESRRGQVQEEGAQVESRVDQLSQEIASLETEASQSDAKIADLQKAIISLDKRIETTEARHKELSLEGEKLEQRLLYLEEQLSHLREEKEAQEFEVKDAEWQLRDAKSDSKSVEKELGELRHRQEELEEERGELIRQSTELEAAVRRLSREYSHLQAEAEAAEKVERGYNRAVSAILEARDTGKMSGIHGTIAELATVKAETRDRPQRSCGGQDAGHRGGGR